MRRRMKIFDCFAVGFLLVLAVNMGIVFFLAFFNGGECLVIVDTFGEQWVEAVLFPIWIVMGIVTAVRLVRRTRRARNAKDI